MVDGHLSECEFLKDGVDDVDREVGEMLESWRSVESGGRNLKEACEALLDERVSAMLPFGTVSRDVLS